MDDDYVAQILAKEAKESSIKYSTQGLSAFMPSKPTSNAPKPNTRFLRNLIKVTDSHNNALKLKEEKEARERMRQLKYQGPGASGDKPSTDRSSKRSDHRSEARGSREHRGRNREDRTRSHGKRNRSRSPSTDQDRSRRHRRRNEDYDGQDRHRHRDEHRHVRRDHESSRRDRRDRDKDKEHPRRRRERSYSRSPSHSPRRERSTDRHRHRHRRQDRHYGRPIRSFSRSCSPEEYKSRRSKREDASPHNSRRSRPETNTQHSRLSPLPSATTRQNEIDDESDPLEDLVGPLPPRQNEAPIRSRGRGAYKPNSSNIDAHFAPSYDPTSDVHLDEENLHPMGRQSTRRPVAGLMTKDDDWDMAMEALRDRERWRKKGEERLRAAGIDEAAIDKWKNNTAFTGLDGEGKPEDVQWSKKGEGREWDRGKFVNDDGHIDIRSTW